MSAKPRKLIVSYTTQEEFDWAYSRELAMGALFAGTRDSFEVGERVRLELHLEFAHRELALEGDVVAVVPEAMSRTGATPGVSIQLLDQGDELHRQLEELSSIPQDPMQQEPAGSMRRSPRFPAHAATLIDTTGGRFPAETVDVGYNGMLVLLRGVDVGEGTEARVVLIHPGSGEQLALEARVVHQTRCDHGVMAVGVHFLYPIDRVDEVTSFINDLRSFHHARRLATVAGSLAETPLETVLDTFASVSGSGTLLLNQGHDEGKVVYSEGEILQATTGLVSGSKALGRMFGWREARFEFQPTLDLADAPRTPMPLAAAVLSAAIERDEVEHLGVAVLGLDAIFAVDTERFMEAKPDLDSLALELVDQAGAGFPLSALRDILTENDAAIYKALASLSDAGILRLIE